MEIGVNLFIQMRQSNFPLNEPHKGQHVIHLFKGRVHLRKQYLPWGTSTDTQKGFISLAIKIA